MAMCGFLANVSVRNRIRILNLIRWGQGIRNRNTIAIRRNGLPDLRQFVNLPKDSPFEDQHVKFAR